MKNEGSEIKLNNELYAMQSLVGMEVVFPMSRADCDSATGITTQVLASEKAKAAFERGEAKGMFEVVVDTDALAGIGL